MEAEDADAPKEMEEGEIPDSFNCCICLDLLYRPVVLPCGHMACFWCVQVSMSGVQDSRCPICRNSYKHFPSICWTLHFMLLKLYPVACKRREDQILAVEKEMMYFSPQFRGDAPVSNVNIGCDSVPGCSSASKGECQSSLDHQPVCKGEARPSVLPDSSMFSTEWTEHCNSSEGIHYRGKKLAPQSTNENGKQLSVADVLCVACKQMLYHPAVLNCGHAYCKACIPDQVDGILRCQLCQCFHPSAHPKVCLEFDQFLEKQFPEEHALRRDSVQINHRDVKTESSQSTRTYVTDYGDRYKCQDCVEQIGFDLCGNCNNTRSILPGRFNQQHTSEHRFELVDMDEQMAMLQAALPGLPIDVSELSENELVALVLARMATDDEEAHDGTL